MPRVNGFYVTVRRRGASPLELQLLVLAPSREAAAELAVATAERDRGGMFEAAHVRPATERDLSEFDAA